MHIASRRYPGPSDGKEQTGSGGEDRVGSGNGDGHRAGTTRGVKTNEETLDGNGTDGTGRGRIINENGVGNLWTNTGWEQRPERGGRK